MVDEGHFKYSLEFSAFIFPQLGKIFITTIRRRILNILSLETFPFSDPPQKKALLLSGSVIETCINFILSEVVFSYFLRLIN